MTNEYLDILKGAPAATGAAPEGNEYLDLLQGEAQRKRAALAGTLTQAVTVNPEQYGAQRRVASYLGYPTAVVQALPALTQQAKVQQVQADASTHPVLEKRYSDEDFAKLAHDDSFTLSKIGDAIKYLVSAPGAARGGLLSDVGRAGRAIASGVPAAGSGLYDAAAAVFGVADQGIQALDDLAAKITGTPTRQIVGTIGPEGFLRYLGGKADDFSKAVQGADPNAGFVEQSVMSGFQSAGQNLATLPLGLAANGEKAMLSAIGLITGGQSYGKARDAGLSPLRAAAYGAEDAVAEVLTEKYLGAAGFLEKVKAGASATKLAIFEITKEVPGELAATLWQNFNEWTNLHPEKSLADFLKEQPEALAQTVIATLVGGGTQIGAVKGIQKVAESVLGMRFESIEAQRSADALAEALKVAGQSKLAERSPEVLAAVLGEMAGDAEIRFDARTLAETLQQSGLDAEAIKQALPSVQDQIVAATEAGGEVRVPVGEFLAGVRGTPLEQTLLQHARIGNNEMSQAEAKQAGEQAAQYLETEAQRVLAQAQDAKAMQESSDRVRQQVLDQLTALGRFRPAINEGYATWAAAFYTTMAGRTGMTPEAFAAKYPLRIVGEAGQGGLAQKADERDLMVSHNLTGANLLHAVKMGGLPVPSLAITKKDTPLTGFGEITLLGDSNLADPKGYASTKVYGADIYSPRYPSVERELDNKAVAALTKRVKPMAEAMGDSLPGTSELQRDGQRELERSIAVMGTFLQEQGVEPDIVMRKGLDEGRRARLEEFGLGTFMDATSVYDLLDNEDFKKAALAETRDAYAKVGKREGLIKSLDTDEQFQRNVVRSVAQEIVNDAKLRARPEADRYATQQAMEKQIADAQLAETYQQWVLDELAKVTKSERIFQGFTNSGNRKYIPHTLENVVKLLKKELRGGESFNYGVGSLRAKFTPEFKSLAAIKKEKGRLVSAEQFEATKKEVDAEFEEVRKAIDADLSNETTIGILEDAAKMGVPKAAKSYGYDISDEVAQKAAKFLTRLRNLPTAYFEAKVLRDVSLSEFKAAVVPEGTDQKVLDELAKAGITDVRTYTRGDETARAEAIKQFDNLFFQQARGSFNPQSLELALSPTADLSTFFHETGHFFLEVMADIASQPDAPAGVQEDMATLLKWFGVPDLATWQGMSLDQQRPYHERFAESIEQYIIEGKAPSVELAPVFRRFRAWVLSVYRSLQQFVTGNTPGPQLSDEVRAVFDRMLASEDQIAQAEEVAGMLPDETATGEALDKLAARSIRDLKWAVNARSKKLKELQAQAADTRKAVKEEVTAEVDASPEMQAKAALDKLKINPDFTAASAQWKEQRAAAETAERDRLRAELYAANPDVQGLAKGQLLAKNKRTIDNQVQARMIEWDRENPRPVNAQTATDADLAVVADSYGFPNAETMLQAIEAFGKREDVIEGLTDQRMLEQHGELVDPRAIADAANEAVHNEARAKALATELKAQAEMLGQRNDTGQTNAAGAKITVNALAEAAKQFGARVVARTPLRDLRRTAWQHTSAERRAGRAWQDATAKGQTEDAVQAKRDQVLNNAAARAAMDALAEGKKILDFFARVAKGTNEKTVEKGRDPDIVNAARAILAAYGIDTPATRGAAEYLAKVEQHDPQLYAALQPSVQGAMAMAQPLQALTFEQLQSLHEEIQSLWHLAKRSRMMEVDGNLLDIDDAATELNARMEAIGVPASLPGEAGALTPGEIRTRWLQHAGSLLRRAEQWAEGMDGKYGGPFLRLVFQPVKTAAEAYRTDRLKYRKAYQALVDNVAPTLQHKLIEAPELNYTFGRGHNGIGHAELLHAILHTGNESNKRKLLLGRKWAVENADGTLDTSKWDAFVKRMQDTGALTKVHYDFAQGVWDLLEQTKPLAQKAHRDVFGRYFDEVTADAFDTPFGEYRGGYVPAQADTRIVPDADLRALQNAENEAMAYSFPTTNKGFTKARVEYNRPLILDLRTIGQHIDKVLLFSHMEPAVRDVQRLLARPAVTGPLNKIDPTIYAGMLTPWLNRSAKQIVETPIVGDGRISRVLSVMRARAGMSLMFANVSNAIQQVTGFSSAFAKLKADGLESSMLRAAAQMVANGPKKMAQDVAALSPFMAQRMDNEISAINQAMNDILLDQSLLERAQAWTSKHAYFLQSALDNTMGPIIWTSAYNGALTKGLGEQDAVRYADGVIRQTQGSTLPEDVSRIETGPAYARLFTQFIGYFNMMANTNASALKQIQQEVGLRKGAGRAFSVVMLGLLVPLWIAEAIAVAMKGGPDDPDGDGYLDDWIAAVFGMGTIKGAFAMIPFLGQLAMAGVNRFNTNPADDRVSASPAVSMLEAAAGVPVDAYKLLKGDQVNAKTAVRDVASLVSIATGLPASALARPLGYLAGEDQGTISPTSTADKARGLVTGVASPESKSK